MEERLRKHTCAPCWATDGGGQRWRLTRLSGRPASSVASADGAAFQHVRRASLETLAPGQAQFMVAGTAFQMHTPQICIPTCVWAGWSADAARHTCTVICY